MDGIEGHLPSCGVNCHSFRHMKSRGRVKKPCINLTPSAISASRQQLKSELESPFDGPEHLNNLITSRHPEQNVYVSMRTMTKLNRHMAGKSKQERGSTEPTIASTTNA